MMMITMMTRLVICVCCDLVGGVIIDFQPRDHIVEGLDKDE